MEERDVWVIQFPDGNYLGASGNRVEAFKDARLFNKIGHAKQAAAYEHRRHGCGFAAYLLRCSCAPTPVSLCFGEATGRAPGAPSAKQVNKTLADKVDEINRRLGCLYEYLHVLTNFPDEFDPEDREMEMAYVKRELEEAEYREHHGGTE